MSQSMQGWTPPVRAIPLTTEGTIISRPGVINTLGVFSIALGALYCLFGLVALMVVWMFFAVMNQLAHMPGNTSTPATAQHQSVAEVLAEDGVPAADRAKMIDGFNSIINLSDGEKSQLDELLAESGKLILPLSGEEIFNARVATNIRRSGHLSTGGEGGTDYFTLGTGRLELTDDRAIFFPADNQPAITTQAIDVPDSSASTLTPDQIRSVIRCVAHLNRSKLKSAQITTLVSTLQNPGQQLITATSDGSDPAAEVSSVTEDYLQNITIKTRHGANSETAILDINGVITTGAAAAQMQQPAFKSFQKIPRPAVEWGTFITIVQLLLGLGLIVSGALLMQKNGRVGRWMHWCYLLIKFPVGITATIMIWIITHQMFLDAGQNGGGPSSPALASSICAGFAAVGLVYPTIVLLILMTHKGFRDFAKR